MGEEQWKMCIRKINVIISFDMEQNETNAVIIPFIKRIECDRVRSQTQTICIETNKCER